MDSVLGAPAVTPTSRVPNEFELFDVAVATREGCVRLVAAEAESVVSLLAVAGFQLQAAHVGARLAAMANDGKFTNVLRDLATDYGGVSSASLNLAVRCSVTVVDLCAAALARLDGRTPRSGREFDTGEVAQYYRFNRPGARLESVADPFLRRLGGPHWANTGLLRDDVTHKRYVRGIYGSTRQPPDPPPLAFPQQIDITWGAAGMVPLDELTRQVVEFAEATFREFRQNIAAVP